jgi:uncharacterized membrane protein HdeD (DUF308 family)
MKVLGEKCLFYVLYSMNTSLVLSGICILIFGIYCLSKDNYASWFDMSFTIFGCVVVATGVYLYFTRFIADLLSLYLSGIAILFSFHLSFSIGILLNNHSSYMGSMNQYVMTVTLCTIGAVIVSCFVIGYLYRNSVQQSATDTDRSISLQFDHAKPLIN